MKKPIKSPIKDLLKIAKKVSAHKKIIHSTSAIPTSSTLTRRNI